MKHFINMSVQKNARAPFVRAALGALSAARSNASRPMSSEETLLTKAAVSPATLSSTEWAGALASELVADFIGGLGPVSAASSIISRGIQVRLGRHSGVRIPEVISGAHGSQFVAEGEPIPVWAAGFYGTTLTPAKIAGIAVVTQETLDSTAAQTVVEQLLIESVGLGLDARLFSDAAATTAAPAGLRNGATAITPATTETGLDLMAQDLGALATAVSGVASGQIAFVAAPAQAVSIALRAPDLPYSVFPSAALATGTVMAIALPAFVSAVDPVPDFDMATDALLHLETEPDAIGTAGSPNVVAAPTQSMFQTQAVGLRVILGTAWALRAPAADAVAVVEEVLW